MEGPRLHPGGAEPPQPGAQFTGRPRGERDCQQLSRWHGAGPHRVGDAVGDGPRLPGARTGEDADRTTDRLGGLALLRVEAGQDVLTHVVIVPAHTDGPAPRVHRRSLTKRPPPRDVMSGIIWNRPAASHC